MDIFSSISKKIIESASPELQQATHPSSPRGMASQSPGHVQTSSSHFPTDTMVDGSEHERDSSPDISWGTSVQSEEPTCASCSSSQVRLQAASNDYPMLDLRDPPMPRSWLRYRGAQISRWIDDPSEPGCPVPRNSVNFDQLERNAEFLGRSQLQISSDAIEFNLLLPPQTELRRSQMDYSFWTMKYDQDTFHGFTAPGLVALQAINRPILEDSEPSQAPHPSEIALALYDHDIGGIESLRYVFALCVVNVQTQHLLMHDIYPSWPRTAPDIWEYGSQQYEEIIGTRIGRTVGYLMLGGFARGSRRIARIVVFCVDSTLQIRFDIEAILNDRSSMHLPPCTKIVL